MDYLRNSAGLIFALLVTWSVAAQDQSTLSLDDCLSKAFDQNSGFQEIQNLEIIRNQNRKIIQTALFPDVSLSGNVNEFVQNSTVVFTDNILPTSTINGARTFGLNTSVNANVDVLNFGRTISDLKAQKFTSLADSERDIQQKNFIIQSVCQTYFDCLLSQEVTKVLDDKIKTSKQALDIAGVKVGLGEIDSLEYYQALINYEQDLTAKLSTGSMELEAMNNLKILLGMELNEQIMLETDIPELNFGRIEMENRTNVDSSSRVIALQNDLESLKFQKRSNAWNMLPSLSVFSGYGYSNQTFQIGIVQRNTALGLSYGLSLNYGLGNVKNGIHQNKLLKAQADNLALSIQDERKTVQSEFSTLTLRSNQLKQAVASNKVILQMAKRSLDNSLVAYELGSIDLTDLRLSQEQYLNARIDVKRSMIDLYMTEIELLGTSNSLESTILRTIN